MASLQEASENLPSTLPDVFEDAWEYPEETPGLPNGIPLGNINFNSALSVNHVDTTHDASQESHTNQRPPNPGPPIPPSPSSSGPNSTHQDSSDARRHQGETSSKTKKTLVGLRDIVLVLAGVAGIFALAGQFVGVSLAKWTARKDFKLYCQTENGGEPWPDC